MCNLSQYFQLNLSLSAFCCTASSAWQRYNDNKNTLHDGDGERPNGGEFGEECKGHYVITVSSNNKPVIVNADKTPLTDPQELYSGCYGRAIINFYVYDTQGSTAKLRGIYMKALCELINAMPLDRAICVADIAAGQGIEEYDLILRLGKV